MKILENVKTIDSLGRIVIPQDMRDEMQIRKKDELSIIMRGEEIRIKKTENFCIACYETENLKKYQNKYICEECIANIKKL